MLGSKKVQLKLYGDKTRALNELSSEGQWVEGRLLVSSCSIKGSHDPEHKLLPLFAENMVFSSPVIWECGKAVFCFPKRWGSLRLQEYHVEPPK